jgi:hypothetical protein
MIIFDNHTTIHEHGQHKNLTIQTSQNNWERFHSCYYRKKEGKNIFKNFLNRVDMEEGRGKNEGEKEERLNIK